LSSFNKKSIYYEKKKRLDSFLSETGRSVSRESAKREIIAGWVRVNGETIRTPSRAITGEEDIRISRPGGHYVSRGGLKLAKALTHFDISLKNNRAVDLGASTGGFTDCMLKAGADLVYSVDVGYGQLDYSLRNDSRVVVMERRNARSLEKSDFDHRIDFVTADLSFISVLKIYGAIKELFSHARGIILIKPQFEAEKGEQKKGVVREKSVHVSILTRTVSSLREM
jgi:23S rRNA (cytidine1920-2'-O)/16S rRNA (cytidine1409-2'-O)-methyltransferase